MLSKTGITKVKTMRHFVSKCLKSLAGIPQTKRHKGKFVKSERCSVGCLWNILLSIRYLIVSFSQIDGGEDLTS